MRNRLFAVALACAVILAACSDQRAALPTAPKAPQGPSIQASVTPGTCTTLDALKAQAQVIFGPGSPDYNSVRGKLDNLQHQIDIGNLADAKTKALDIVNFVKTKWEEGGLPGTKDQIDEFVLGVMCFAGYDLDAGDVIIVLASSTTPVGGTNDDHDAGIQAPPGGFNVPDGTPVVITVSEIPAGLLHHTKLDQYPGVFNFDASADITDGQKIVIGVCVTGVLPPAAILNRLRLGHNPDGDSFEITEAADPPPGLNCPTSSAMRGIPRWLAAIGRLLAPKALQAASLATGGVGGSAGKLSPFAPIDPTLSATGGTGGSAGKLSPPAMVRGTEGGTQNVYSGPCEFPVGGQVSEACRPQVTIMTALYKAWVDGGMVGPQQGNVFSGVPVQFEIGAGGGTVAAEPACTSGSSLLTAYTGANGFVRACWTLGSTAGEQKVWVTPQLGGEADNPEIVFEPATLTFFATGNPPEHVHWIQQPTNTSAGSTITPSPTVSVHDKNHVQVPIASGSVSLTLSSNSFAAGSTTSSNAVNGLATFSNLVITTAATGYTISAAYSGVTSATSSAFDVGAGAAALIKTFMPPGPSAVAAQSFDYGISNPFTNVSPSPQVRVTDQYGNPVGAGTTVFWVASGASGGSLTVNGGGSTGAGGTAQVSAWNLGVGVNQLAASLYASNPVGFSPAIFTATTATGLTSYMCELGVPDGNFVTFGSSNTGKVNIGPIRVKEPVNKHTIDVAFYMSVTGQSSATQTYPAEIRVYRTNSTATSPGTNLVGSAIGSAISVTLPGNNGNPAFQEVRLTTPVLGDAGTSNYLWFVLTLINPPSNRTFQYWQTSKNASTACNDAVAYSSDLKKTTAAPAIRLKY